jgi:hypothetical protein
MRKIIARIVAVIVCAFAAMVIYNGVQKTYFHESINDFIAQGENFANNRPIDPSEVQDSTTNGKFVRYIAIYWKTFQDLNNEMDTETTRMLSLFNPKNLESDELIEANIVKMNDYRALVQDRSEKIEKNVQSFLANVSTLEQEELQVGNIAQVKVEVAKDAEFRQNVVDIRKTIAGYMYAALEFLQSRRQSIKFEANGAITFANPADQKYFYDLMAVIREADVVLKGLMIQNRNDIRSSTVAIKSAYEKAM